MIFGFFKYFGDYFGEVQNRKNRKIKYVPSPLQE